MFNAGAGKITTGSKGIVYSNIESYSLTKTNLLKSCPTTAQQEENNSKIPKALNCSKIF